MRKLLAALSITLSTAVMVAAPVWAEPSIQPAGAVELPQGPAQAWLLADLDKTEMEETLRTAVGDLRTTRLVGRRGGQLRQVGIVGEGRSHPGLVVTQLTLGHAQLLADPAAFRIIAASQAFQLT